MGGNVFDEVIKIPCVKREGTYGEFLTTLGATGVNTEGVAPVGSYGKKPPGADYGDLDLALMVQGFPPTREHYILYLEELSATLLRRCADRVVDAKVLRANAILAIRFKSSFLGGHCQVDLIPCQDLEWASFIFSHPDYYSFPLRGKFYEAEELEEGARFAPAVIRNFLLDILLDVRTRVQIDEHTWRRQTIDLIEGRVEITKSFMGKRGLLKRAVTLERSQITRPTDFRELLNFLGLEYVGDNRAFDSIWRHVLHGGDRKIYSKDDILKIHSKLMQRLRENKIAAPKLTFPT